MKLKSLIILSLMFVFSSVIFAAPKPEKNVYGVFSEISSGVVFDAGPSNENAVLDQRWTGEGFDKVSVSTANVIEGKECWEVKSKEGAWCGFAVHVNNSAGSMDMSSYKSVKFIVKSTCSSMGNLKVGIEGNAQYQKTLYELNFIADGNWHELTFPVDSYALNNVKNLFIISGGSTYKNGEGTEVKYPDGDTIYFDNIRWEKADIGPTGVMSLNMFEVKGNKELPSGSSFSFDVNIDEDGLGWKVAKEYVKIDFNLNFNEGAQKYDSCPCYIRIYTDNTGAGADPKYTGEDLNPAGLINVGDTKVRLDMCWRVSNSLIDESNLKIYQYKGEDDNEHLSDKQNEGNCYLWMQDISRKKKNGNAGDAFDNIYSYIWNNGSDIIIRGAQFGEYTFSAPAFPLYVYLGAKFVNSVTAGEIYSTNKLTIELLYE